ncbi:unnamed protein product [Arctogadus glacialis]
MYSLFYTPPPDRTRCTPPALTQLARANPFSAPLFSLQRAEELQQTPAAGPAPRRLAAAATAVPGPPDVYSGGTCAKVPWTSFLWRVDDLSRLSASCWSTVAVEDTEGQIGSGYLQAG